MGGLKTTAHSQDELITIIKFLRNKLKMKYGITLTVNEAQPTYEIYGNRGVSPELSLEEKETTND